MKLLTRSPATYNAPTGVTVLGLEADSGRNHRSFIYTMVGVIPYGPVDKSDQAGRRRKPAAKKARRVSAGPCGVSPLGQSCCAEAGSAPLDMINGKYAIVTGMVGLDCAHSCVSELHPVWAMAIQAEDPRWSGRSSSAGGETKVL